MTKAKKPVVNQDLWKDLDEQAMRHQMTWTWTKGHANHADNNRCLTNWRPERRKISRAAKLASQSSKPWC